MAGYWSIVLPQATTNLVTNPSFELGVTGWTKVDGGSSTSTFARSTTYSFRGAASAKIDFTFADIYSFYSSNAAPVTVGQSYTASIDFYVPGSIGSGTYELIIDWFDVGGGYLSSSGSAAYTTTGRWFRASVTGTAPASAVTAKVDIRCNVASFILYIDGAQFEQQSAASTYCDGDQKDCKWAAAKHLSTSTRSVRTRAGGQIVNLDSLGLYIEEISGIGHPDAAHRVRTQPQRDGGKLLGHTVLPRSFELAGIVPGSSRENLHTLRKALINAIKADAVLDDTQPCILRYSGSKSTKEAEIYANYDTGFGLANIEGYTERMGVRWVAYDPYFYEAGETAATLTTSSAITDANYIIAKIDGAWQALSTGMNGMVSDIVKGDDGSIYAGGAFSTAGGTTTNSLAKWNGSAWSMVGATTGLDSNTNNIIFDAAGNLYAGGAFHNADGTLVNHCAKWDGSAWSMLGTTTGFDDEVTCMAIGYDGTIYAGGYFHAVDGTTVNHCAKWNGTAWSMVGVTTGLSDYPMELKISPDGYLYACGLFATADGTTVNRVAKWDGAAWQALSTGCATAGAVMSIEFTPSGLMYSGELAGDFKLWNGASWSLVSSLAGEINNLKYDVGNGLLYISGYALVSGDISGDFLTWNGTAYSTIDITLPPSTPKVRIALFDNDDIYLGFDTAGTATTSYSGTITNNGTHEAYPVIHVKRSGGTSATLSWIKNETTGKTLWFNYALLDGEEIIIDLRPGSRNITSSFWGNAWRALQRGSDFSSFNLLPGANIVTTVITEVGSPTMTAYASWRNTHWSADGTAA